MGAIILVGLLFAILPGIFCIGCAVKDFERFRKYEDMLDEHERDQAAEQA